MSENQFWLLTPFGCLQYGTVLQNSFSDAWQCPQWFHCNFVSEKSKGWRLFWFNKIQRLYNYFWHFKKKKKKLSFGVSSLCSEGRGVHFRQILQIKLLLYLLFPGQYAWRRRRFNYTRSIYSLQGGTNKTTSLNDMTNRWTISCIVTSGLRLLVHHQASLYHMNGVLRNRPRIRQSFPALSPLAPLLSLLVNVRILLWLGLRSWNINYATWRRLHWFVDRLA